jgi:hypothetical protein
VKLRQVAKRKFPVHISGINHAIQIKKTVLMKSANLCSQDA